MPASVNEWKLATARAAELVTATIPGTIAHLEREYGLSQNDAVTHFLEQTEWGLETFPEFQGGKGSKIERLNALRSRWHEWEAL